MIDVTAVDRAGSSRRKRGRWLRRLIIFSLAISLTLALLPKAIAFGIKRTLMGLGADVVVLENVDFNPFVGALVLEGLEVRQGGERALALSLFRVDLAMEALWEGRIHLAEIALHDLFLLARQKSGGPLWVAGVRIPDLEGEEATSAEPEGVVDPTEGGLPLAVGLDRFELQRGEIRLQTGGVELTGAIEESGLRSLATWTPDQPAVFHFRGGVNDAPLDVSLRAWPFASELRAEGKVVLEGLELETFAPLARTALSTLSGKLNLDFGLTFRLAEGGTVYLEHDGRVSVADLGVAANDMQVNQGSFSWEGKTRVTQATGMAVPDLAVNGRLESRALQVRGGFGTVSHQSLVWEGETVVKGGEADRIPGTTLNGSLELTGLDAGGDFGRARQGRLVWRGQWTVSEGPVGGIPGVTGEGRLESSGLAASGSFGVIGLEGVSFDGKVGVTPVGAGLTPPVRIVGELIADGAGFQGADSEESVVSDEAEDSRSPPLAANGVGARTEAGFDRFQIGLKAAFDSQDGSGIRISQEGPWRITGARFEDGLNRVAHQSLHWRGRYALTQGESAESLQAEMSGTLEGEGANIALKEPALVANLAGYHWEGQGALASLDLQRDLSVQAVMALSGLSVRDSAGAIDLASWEKLGIEGFEMAGLDRINLDRVSLTGILLGQSRNAQGQPRTGADSPLFQASGLALSHIALSGMNDLAVQTVDLTRGHIRLRRDRQGALGALDAVLVALNAPRSDSPSADSSQSSPAASSAVEEDFRPTPPPRLRILPRPRLIPLARFSTPTGRQNRREAVAATTTPGGALRVRLGRFQLDGPTRIYFQDQYVQPPFNTRVDIVEGQLGPLDSGETSAETPFVLVAKVDEYGGLRIEGSLLPLAHRPTGKVSLNIDGFELPPFSPYITPLIGYELHSGSLNTTLDLGVDLGVMDGAANLLIHHLKLQPAVNHSGSDIGDRLDMPLDAALSLLRDSEDNIQLKLPISGDVDDPSIDPSDAINQALAKAVKVAAFNFLTAAIQPYGTILRLAMMAGEQLDRIGFDPVPFPPGAVNLDGQRDDFYEKIARILEQRPEMRFKVCGFSSPMDQAFLQAQATEGEPSDETGEEEDSSDEEFGSVLALSQESAESDPQASPDGNGETAEPEAPVITREMLLDLAKRRALAVKRRLVEGFGVESGRLNLCLPEFDETPDSEPRVEIAL